MNAQASSQRLAQEYSYDHPVEDAFDVPRPLSTEERLDNIEKVLTSVVETQVSMAVAFETQQKVLEYYKTLPTQLADLVKAAVDDQRKINQELRVRIGELREEVADLDLDDEDLTADLYEAVAGQASDPDVGRRSVTLTLPEPPRTVAGYNDLENTMRKVITQAQAEGILGSAAVTLLFRILDGTAEADEGDDFQIEPIPGLFESVREWWLGEDEGTITVPSTDEPEKAAIQLVATVLVFSAGARFLAKLGEEFPA